MLPSLGAAAARRLDQDMAGRPAAAVALSDPYLAAWLGRFHASHNGARIETGQIVDVAAGAYAYLVDAGPASTTWCSPGGTTAGFAVFGSRPLTTYPLGSTVYFIRHPQTPTIGTIIAAEPHWSDTTRNQPADGIWPFTRSGRGADSAHRFAGAQSALLSTAAGDGGDLGGVDLIDYSAGRPLDATGIGEWGVMAETGVGVFADPFQAYLRADETTGVFAFYPDQLLRVSGHNYQHSTSHGEEELLEDQGELLGYRRWCVYVHELSGLWRWNQVTPGWEASSVANAGLPPGQGLAFTDPVESQFGSGFVVREPERYDALPAARIHEWLGYLGQGGRRLVAAPAQLEQLIPSPGAQAAAEALSPTLVAATDAPDGRLSVDGQTAPSALTLDVPVNSRSAGHDQPGVLEESRTLTGSYRVRAARDIILARRVSIPTPRQVLRPEDPLGDSPDNYRPSGLGVMGTGDEHAVEAGLDVPGGSPHRACMLPDVFAYMFNWEGLAPFAYHTNDWAVPQEGLAGTTLVNQKPHDYESLAATQYLAAPAPTLLDIDHRYGKINVYETESHFALLEDGTVVIGDGWGSEIRMTGGNIEFHCAGDVAMFPGRNLLSWAGHDIVMRAHDSADLTAGRGDLRLKADRNLHGLAGNSGCGGFLWESKAICAAQGYEDRVGERVTSSGFTVIVPYAQFSVLAGDVAIALEDTSSDGRIYLDAGNSRHIHTRSRTFVTRITMDGSFVQLFDGTSPFPNPSANEFCGKYNLFGQDTLFADEVYMAKSLKVESTIRAVGTVTGSDTTGFGLLSSKVLTRQVYLAGEYRDAYDVELVFPPHTEDAEFSLRTAGQYLSTDYDYWQPRWRSIADGDMQVLPTWEEPTVAGLRSETITLPHPGERWLDAEGFRYHSFSLVDTADGWVAIDRDANRGDYETPTVASAPSIPLSVWYTVPVPAGIET